MVWEEVMRVAVSNGIFAVLFCLLLVYELRVTGKRENKYQTVIEQLAQSLTCLNEVKAEVENIERLLSAAVNAGENDEERCSEIEKTVPDEAGGKVPLR